MHDERSYTVADVVAFFEQMIQEESVNLTFAQKEAAAQGAEFRYAWLVRESIRRYESLKQHRAPEFILEQERKMCGGDEPLTFRQRVGVYLRNRVASSYEQIGEYQKILDDLSRGDHRSAVSTLACT